MKISARKAGPVPDQEVGVGDKPLKPAAAVILLCAVIGAVFWSTVFYGLVNYDDVELVLANPFTRSLDAASLKEIFTRFYPFSYYPVRLLSFAIDHRLWGPNPMGYHLTNLLIHLANALLLFWFFFRLQEPGEKTAAWGGLAAALFLGIHPVVTEPVAWIPGREELLLLFFTLLCLHCLAGFEKSGNRLLLRILAAYACICACLSNVMGAVIPVVAVLFFLRPGARRAWKEIAADVWFLWLIGLAAVFVKLLAKASYDPRTQGLAYFHVSEALANMGSLWAGFIPKGPGQGGVFDRMLIVISVVGEDIQHVFWPWSLPVFYPPRIPTGLGDPRVLAGLGLLGAFGGLLFLFRRRAAPWFGAVWFLAALTPTAQVLHNHIWRADRFLYVPLAGMALVAGWLFLEGERRFGARRTHAVLAALCLVLGARTAWHAPVYADGLSLKLHAVGENPDFYLAHQDLGREYYLLGFPGKALQHFLEALALAPDKNYMWAFVLSSLKAMDDLPQAESLGKKAVEEQPDNPYRHNYLATVYSLQGKSLLALEHFKKAVKLDPEGDEIFHNLGLELMGQGRSPEAVYYLQKAYDLYPKNLRTRLDLAKALEASGQEERALRHYEQLAGDSRFPEARAGVARLKGRRQMESGHKGV